MNERQTEHPGLRMSSRLLRQCQRVAARSGLKTTEWMRAVLARAANEGAFAPRKKRPPRRK